MKYTIQLFLCCLLLSTVAQGQQAGTVLDIQFNKNIVQPGDSLQVKVQYTGSNPALNQKSLATLELIIENEAGQRTRLRWPFINGQASGSVYLPGSLSTGKYNLLAGLQQRYFEVTGEVKNAKNTQTVQAMLLTKNGEWDEQQVSVMSNGTFFINNWLFEDNALLAFAATNKSRQPLDIRITTRLDSSSTPLAVAGKIFYVGKASTNEQQDLAQQVDVPESAFIDKGNLLPAVLVRTTTKSPAQQFDEEYASALFRSGNERMLSIMDDPAALSSLNILNYLQGRVAGLQISPAGLGGGTASWRGGPVAFFLDEVRISAQAVASIPMTDIAIVKAYPPPFFGSFGGAAGIAVYTRRGGESRYLPANRQVFRVRGYTPASTVLDMNKLLL